MAIGSLAPSIRSKPGFHNRAFDAVIIIGAYMAIYVALDRMSFFHVLPGTCFTPWNPPPAISLALLLLKGLCFAPLLFVAGVFSDVVAVGCPPGILATIIANVIIAVGYTALAAALRRFAHTDQGLARAAEVAYLLLMAAMGTLAVAGCAVCVLAMMKGLPPNLAYRSFWHFFIGDLTGILGVLPAVLTVPQARERWKEVPPAARALDLGLFTAGLVFALLMVFGVTILKEVHFHYLLLLPVAWIAVRHGLAWCGIAILVTQLALVSVVATLDYQSADFLADQIRFLEVAAIGLILGAVVTERQRAELNLRQQQAELYRTARITTAGALGAAVVHEIGQPLATLATYAHVCRRLLVASPIDIPVPALRETLAKLEAEVRRAGDIIDHLRDFLGRSEPRWSPLDLTDITRRVVAALADTARSFGVTVRIDARPLAQIAADRIQLEQVLVNLIRNALEAAGESREQEKMVWIRLRQVVGENELVIEDNGPGIPADVADRLFKPFETSKQRGMGLGLSLSREIVKAHGGRLWWDAASSPGARFVLRLPCDKVGYP
jgi:two-component system, LuxR family, sensor kinase FixL